MAAPDTLELKLIEYLQKNNMRITNERKLIAATIARINANFNTELLTQKVQDHYPGISRATVYRTVALMLKAGLLREAWINNGIREFTHAFLWKPHGHMQCDNCGKVDTFDNGLIKQINRILTEEYGMKPLIYNIMIKGWCRSCQQKQGKE